MTLRRLNTRSLVKLYWRAIKRRDTLCPHWLRWAGIADRIGAEITRRAYDARLLPRR